MRPTTPTDVAVHLRGFLHHYVPRQKGFSTHTILSYRDTMKLLLLFIAAARHIPIARLRLVDLSPDMILGFLTYLEDTRGNSPQTRNIRLACIHSFFGYVAHQEPLLLHQCSRILAIPFKRTPDVVTEYLERDEITALLGVIDQERADGYRDYTLFSFLYHTGARVGEVIHLCTGSLHLERPFQVRFRGKGAKERLCPLWPETARLLRQLLRRRKVDCRTDLPVFVNHRGEPFTRSGVRYLLAHVCHSRGHFRGIRRQRNTWFVGADGRNAH